MKLFIRCLNKDRLEFMRGKKNILCLFVVFACACVVLVTTMLLPFFLDKFADIGVIFSSDTSLGEFMEQFFPNDLKKSLGMFCSDIGVFYSLVVIFITYNVLPDEISSGKVILPLCAGYNKKVIFFSKQLVYSLLCMFPVLTGYMLYYCVGNSLLSGRFPFVDAITNAIVIALAEFFVAASTIALSVIFKKKYVSLIVMASIIMVAPDMLHYFNFGQYFPTFLLTYTYNSLCNPSLLILPITFMIILLIFLDIFAIRFDLLRIIDDRR